MENTLTFANQAERFMEELQTRRRNPAKIGTIRAYRSHLRAHILPTIGNLPLSQVENGTLKTLVSGLMAKKLSAATCTAITSVVKQVVSSAVDANGNELYPRKWNNAFIDLPQVQTASQDAPTVSLAALQTALQAAKGQDKALYALLAGTGLRVGEALSLMAGVDDGINSFWIPESGMLTIRTTLVNGKIQPSTKTEAGRREVDIAPELNSFLVKTLQPSTGLLFQSRSNGPIRIGTAYEHLRGAGINEGFHAFRRFRITHLESENVPAGLQRFWTGHQAGDVHESYVKMGANLDVRRDWAKRAGLGFKLEVL